MTQNFSQDELNKLYRDAFAELQVATDALGAYLRRDPNEVDAVLRERLQVALQRASEKAEEIYRRRPQL